jgi:hypothetical protein
MPKWISAGLVIVFVLSLLVALPGLGCAGAAKETTTGQQPLNTNKSVEEEWIQEEEDLGRAATDNLTKAKSDCNFGLGGLSPSNIKTELGNIIEKIKAVLEKIKEASKTKSKSDADKAKDEALNIKKEARDEIWKLISDLLMAANNATNELKTKADIYYTELRNAYDAIKQMIDKELQPIEEGLGKKIIDDLNQTKKDFTQISGNFTNEVDKIIGKINDTIEAIIAGDKDKAINIKRDALKEIDALIAAVEAKGKKEGIQYPGYIDALKKIQTEIQEMIDREEEFAALPPGLKSPADGAMVSSLIPKLEWNASTEATYFGLQVATDSVFTNLVVNESGITDLYYDVPLGALNWNTTYYWRVNATNAAGTSLWSDYWQFKTAAPLPAAPALKAPQNGSTVSNRMPSLEWNVSATATSYGLQVATDSAFTDLVVSESGITDLNYIVPLGALNWNTTYYWRVNATNAAGTSLWSDYWQFKTPS